ncbi:MAG: transporter [Burkholderiales bacterium]|nr:MAG: transporter [Burkholderiales bacterium]
MTNMMVSVTTYALLPMAAAIIGAVVSTFRPPGPKLRSAIQHFAAGVVFSVVAVELLPDIVRSHARNAAFDVVIGFALGVIAMLALKAVTERMEAAKPSGTSRLPVAFLVAISVDLLVDGLLIGMGFTAGVKEGRLLTLALTVELLSLGLAVAVTLSDGGASRARIIAITAALATVLLVGAVGGVTLLVALSPGALEMVFAFGLAALLFLVTEELLTEAHEVPENAWITSTFFAGFLLFLVLGMVG